MDAWIIFMRHASLHAGSRQQLDRLKPSSLGALSTIDRLKRSIAFPVLVFALEEVIRERVEDVGFLSKDP